MVVDEQTRQLKDRDQEIQALMAGQWERKFHDLQQTMIVNSSSGQLSQSTLILHNP